MHFLKAFLKYTIVAVFMVCVYERRNGQTTVYGSRSENILWELGLSFHCGFWGIKIRCKHLSLDKGQKPGNLENQ